MGKNLTQLKDKLETLGRRQALAGALAVTQMLLFLNYLVILIGTSEVRSGQ